jgi:hypothetical protein
MLFNRHQEQNKRKRFIKTESHIQNKNIAYIQNVSIHWGKPGRGFVMKHQDGESSSSLLPNEIENRGKNVSTVGNPQQIA